MRHTHMLTLDDLLHKIDLDPKTTLVMRHRPTERDLRRALRWCAAEDRAVFDAYQRCQPVHVEAALCKAQHLVSTFGTEAGKATFVGVYHRRGEKEMPGRDWLDMPSNKRLIELGDSGPNPKRTIKYFDLVQTPHLQDWSGRLVLRWSPPERSWYRWASKNEFLVDAILPESGFVRRLPAWHDIVLSWAQLQTLPLSWRAALQQWRGIYVIADHGSSKLYVGSAYGRDNILARWQQYANSGHGGNVDLKGRDPHQFRFAILQVVAPDLDADSVIALEGSWKDRLATREFGLNKN